MTARELKEVVDNNRKYLNIPNRREMVQMVYFVSELLDKADFKEAAMHTKELADELDTIDTSEIVKEHIW